MEVKEVSANEYSKYIKPRIQYDRVEFNELNVGKVDSLHYILFFDTNVRFGLVYGVKNNEGFIPFSAPFGCIVNARKKWEVLQLDSALDVFEDYLIRKGLKGFRWILPPDFYDSTMITVLQNKLFRQKYMVEFQDLNYALDLMEIKENTYEKVADRNARRNIRIADKAGLYMIECKTVDERNTAYDVIKHNREYRGFPLRMSREQVMDTIEVVPADMFLIRYPNKKNAASAIVYHVTEDVVQVIYWGNEPGEEDSKPVNFLAYKLSEFYIANGYKYLDIGPSTENGFPNFGLCDFKRKIGCKAFPKMILKKEFENG